MGKKSKWEKRYTINHSFNKLLLWYEGCDKYESSNNIAYEQNKNILEEDIKECRRYKVCKNPIGTFNNMLESEEIYFHDESSIDFLKNVSRAEYVHKKECTINEKYIEDEKNIVNEKYIEDEKYTDNEKYVESSEAYLLKKEDGTYINIKQLPQAHKNALVLINNSYKQIYTVVEYITDESARYLRNINDMILYAALQIDKENSDINKWHQIVDAFLDLEIVNYRYDEEITALRVYSIIYYNSVIKVKELGGYAAIGLKDNQYVSDVKIFDYLYFKYHMNYFLGTLRMYNYSYKNCLENKEELSDILEDLWINNEECLMEDENSEKKIEHNTYSVLEHNYPELGKVKCYSSKLKLNSISSEEKSVICIDYNKDSTLTVREYITPESCDIFQVLHMINSFTKKYDKPVSRGKGGNIKRTFFIVIEQNHSNDKYRSSLTGRLIYDTWFGGYIYRNYLDVYDSKAALLCFTDVVTDLYNSAG